MIKLAIYGKGGIGKSTLASNLSVAFAKKGLTVLQIGCDPKADSTVLLHKGEAIPTILSLIKEKKDELKLSDMIFKGTNGVLCAEAGGPPPGLGCAGRGIITALQTIEQKGVFQTYSPDIVIYDVLGDVVCGGFTMPIRDGYADEVFIVTSGEKMSMRAAENIALAVDNFKARGYARIGGVILNHRNVKDESEKVQELAKNIGSSVIGEIDFSEDVQKSEESGKTVLEAFPESKSSKQYLNVADAVLNACRGKKND